MLEFARDVLCLSEINQSDFNPYKPNLFVSPLSCSLIGETKNIYLTQGTKSSLLYGVERRKERYNCNFGLNDDFKDQIVSHGFVVAGNYENSNVRIPELHISIYLLILIVQMNLVKDKYNEESKENFKMEKQRIFTMPFSKVYPLYIQKAEKKGRTKEEVDEIIFWLTGYDEHSLQQLLIEEVNMETFFTHAPHMNPNVVLIKGVICGYRVEEIEDDLMRNIRYLDKLIDELAKGKAMEKILR